MARNNWTREEHLIAFNLYCKIPFGKIGEKHPAIRAVAEYLGRSPAAVAMKLVNFASHDPTHQSRGVTGLKHGSKEEIEIWEEFNRNPNAFAVASETEIEKVAPIIEERLPSLPLGPTEGTRTSTFRLVQTFFRDSVLASYNYSCSFCELSLRQMLTASHIIPWKDNIERRADPRNGFCLCAFHDRAFDRGILAVSEDLHILVSPQFELQESNEMSRVALSSLAGRHILEAVQFRADPVALEYHRLTVFKK